MQTPIVQQHLHEEEPNRGPLYEQTSGLSEHAYFLHSSKQENSVSSLNLPAVIMLLNFQKALFKEEKRQLN